MLKPRRPLELEIGTGLRALPRAGSGQTGELVEPYLSGFNSGWAPSGHGYRSTLSIIDTVPYHPRHVDRFDDTR